MRPLKIYIEPNTNNALNLAEIKYAFKTILNIAGFACHYAAGVNGEPVDIYYGKKTGYPCRLFIQTDNLIRADINIPVQIKKEEGIIFFFFKARNPGRIIIAAERGQKIFNDIIFSTYYFLCGWQECFMRRDRKDIHAIEDAFTYKNKIIEIPVINQYALLFRRIFKDLLPLPLWPQEKKFAVMLSHDVDYPEMLRWIEGLRYLLRSGKRSELAKCREILSGKESFWKFPEWIALEKDFGFKSAFYFCGFKGNLFRYARGIPDPFYDVNSNNFKEVMRNLQEDGFEIGMHGSYLAYRSEKRFNLEKETVERACDTDIFGNRHHYWHIHPDKPYKTARLHEKIGLLYDSSLSFEKKAGFRYLISSPFHLFDPSAGKSIGVLQFPPTLMDDHLFGQQQYAYSGNFRDEIDVLVEAVRRSNGIFVADYHVRILNNTFFPRWKESYIYLLKKILQYNDYYADTPLNIAGYWLNREQKIEEASIDETSGNHQ
jgi:hypothetical protein